MQAIPMALAVIGGGVKAYGQVKAGNENKKQAYGQAREEEAVGAERELRIRRAASAAIGEQVAAQSANGFMGGTGSALDALAESQINAVLDAMTVRREAAGRARALRAQGDQAQRMGRMSAIETMIGTAGQVYNIKKDWAAVNAPYKSAPTAAPPSASDSQITVTYGR